MTPTLATNRDPYAAARMATAVQYRYAAAAENSRGDGPSIQASHGSEEDQERVPLVLVIDDDRAIRDSLSMVLDAHGLECMAAHNGEAALRRLRESQRRPDLIVLDLMMPVMNGWDFRTAQLADPDLATIPTIILSAASDTPAQARDLSVAHSIRKPVDLDDLLETVEHLIPGWHPED